MPGGEQAIREPWQMAAYLIDAGRDDAIFGDRLPSPALATVRRMIERGLNAPPTSSMGRLFDGVAALAGVRDRVSYEGQVAMKLEWLASGSDAGGNYPFEIREIAGEGAPLLIDARPLICGISEEVRRGYDAATIGRRFHSTAVEIVARVCSRLRERAGLSAVALSGGGFLRNYLKSCLEFARPLGFS